MQFIDYYETLGVARGASAEEIRRAYRKIARKFHPDVNKDQGAAERFKRANEANAVLSDPEKRAKYDRYGSAWESVRAGGAPPPDVDGVPFEAFRGGAPGGTTFEFGPEGFSSFFDLLFGGGGRQGQGGPVGARGGGLRFRGADAEARLPLALEEAAGGCVRHVAFVDPLTHRQRTVEVRVPKGVRPGQRIRLAGQGGPGVGGGEAGDLHLVVEFLPHARFRLEGRDLHGLLDVTPWDAALGGEVVLEALEGAVSVKVPAGSAPGRRIRLRGKGFPGAAAGPGDLYVEIRLVLPEKLTDEQVGLLRQLKEAAAGPEPVAKKEASA